MSTQDAIRTCIGCRRRSTATDLLRVVVAGATGESGEAAASLLVVPDPRRNMPGRGAWLHRDPACVELAQRRRAFGRALRVTGPSDPEPVVEYVAAHYGVTQHDHTSTISVIISTPQETKS